MIYHETKTAIVFHFLFLFLIWVFVSFFCLTNQPTPPPLNPTHSYVSSPFSLKSLHPCYFVVNLSSNHCVLAQVSTLVQQQQQQQKTTKKKKNNQVSWAFFFLVRRRSIVSCRIFFFFVFQFSINILGFFTLFCRYSGGRGEKKNRP